MATVATTPEHESATTKTGVGEFSRSTAFGSPQLLCALLLVATDLLTIVVAVFSACEARVHLLPHFVRRAAPVTFSVSQYGLFCSIWLVLVVFLGVEGLYTQRRTLWNEMGHLLKAVGLGVVAIFAALALTKLGPLVSRATILLTALTLLWLLPFVRYWSKWILGKLGPWRKRVVILGAGDAARLAIQGLLSDPVFGYEVVGVLDENPVRKGEFMGACHGSPIFVLGDLNNVTAEMERSHARDLLIAMPDLPEEKLLALVHRFQAACDSVYVVPHLWGLPMMNLHVDGFLRERVMMLKLSNNLAKPWNQWFKRTLDVLLGLVMSMVAFPLCVLISLLIRLDSDGPVLFIQERIGFDGKIFRCIKFRTMHPNSDEVLANYLDCNHLAAEEWKIYAKLRDYDPRVTRIGRILRHWSLDELPQLLNVLRGEMSVIGPRPYLPEEGPRIGLNQSTILSARPGITGFWQVNGRNELSLEERVQLEAWYVRNWTVWLDCIVLGKTFRAILQPRASRNSKAWDIL